MKETVEDIMDVVAKGEAKAQDQGEAKANNIFMDNLTCLLIVQGPHELVIIVTNLVIFKKISYKLHGWPQQHQLASTTFDVDSSKGNVAVMSNEEFAWYNQFQISQPASSTTTVVQT